MDFHWRRIDSPVGPLHLAAREDSLRGVLFEPGWESFKARFGAGEERTSAVLDRAAAQLAEYFAGRRKDFDLPLRMDGTDFQKKTWSALPRIPYGRTATYGELAVSLSSPGAVRAVGRANGANPLCIVLPCHRVVGASGALTGYAGGLEAKRFLLRLEGASVPAAVA